MPWSEDVPKMAANLMGSWTLDVGRLDDLAGKPGRFSEI